MDNLALPALLAILGLLPGIAFFWSYYSGTFARRYTDISAMAEIGQYILFSIPFGWLGVQLAHSIFGLDFQYGLALSLFAGTADKEATGTVATLLNKNAAWSVAAYVLTLIVAALTGSALRRIVWACRLDVDLPLLRMRNDWYYVLAGRQDDMPKRPGGRVPLVDVLVQHEDGEGGTRIYAGVVYTFNVTREGKLESLTLVKTQRGKGRSTEFKWVEIPGEKFVIMGPLIHTINTRYYDLTPTLEKGERRRQAWSSWWRSFWFQEP